jgi:hypothetical protein
MVIGFQEVGTNKPSNWRSHKNMAMHQSRSSGSRRILEADEQCSKKEDFVQELFVEVFAFRERR